MDLIKTGIRVGKTIRNAGRLKEIATVFAKNGFDEFLRHAPLSKILPGFVLPHSDQTIEKELEDKELGDWNRILGSRLRICFEELGPAFVKLGQLLSSRSDIFEPAFIDEMKSLRDKVKGIPFEEARTAIEKSLGKKIEDCFSSIDSQPVGTASIGIVYKATLKDGSPVVIKLRRPDIKRLIEVDFSILLFLVGRIEKMSSEFRAIGVSRILRDFSTRIKGELNFTVEAFSCERLKKNIAIHDSEGLVVLPKIYKEYSSESMLVMEYLKGISFNNTARIMPYRDEILPKLEAAVKIYVKTFLQDGFFHADLHQGNFLLLDNGQIGILDFGLVGHLSKKGRKNFLAIIYSLLSHNYETLVYEFLDVAEYEQIPDVENLISDIRDVLIPFAGMTVKEVNSGILLQESLKILSKHKIYLPREWFIVFRSLIVLDGVGKSMEMDQDLFMLIEDDVKKLLQTSLSKDELLEETLWMAKDLLGTLRMFPRHAKWFMRDFTRKGHALEVINKGYEKEFIALNGALVFLGFAFLGGVFLLAGVYVLGDSEPPAIAEIPLMSVIFWFLSCIFILRGLWAIRKKS